MVKTKTIKTTIIAAKGKQQPRVPRKRRVGLSARNLTDCAKRFAMCVLDPTSAPAKVPDGACHSVLIEFDLAVTGTPSAEGYLGFMAYPGLPCSGVGLVGTFTGPTRESSIATASIAGGSWIMFPFPDFASGVAAAVSGTVVLYNKQRIKSARVVSYKLEVVPSGSLLNQGGVAVTARVPLSFDFQHTLMDTGTAIANKTYAGNTSHPYYVISDAGLTFSGVSAYPEAKMCSGTESCVLMGMPQDYDFIPSYPSTRDQYGNMSIDAYPWASNIFTVDVPPATGTPIAAAGGTPGNPYAAMLPSDATDKVAFGNFWQYERGDALVWTGQGLPASQSYEFRVRVCAELCVDPISAYRPFVTPPEAAQIGVVERVRNVVSALPSSIPKADSSPGWWANLTEAATGISDFVGELGIPIVSNVARGAKKLVSMLTGG